MAYLSSTQQLYILNTDFANLHSAYTAGWKGIMPNVGAKINISKRVLLSAMGKCALVDYNATADWNLIEMFMHPVSFRQHAKGKVIEGEVGIEVNLNRVCAIMAKTNFSRFSAHNGVDESFLQNGNRLFTRFNGAQFSSLDLKIGLRIEFGCHLKK